MWQAEVNVKIPEDQSESAYVSNVTLLGSMQVRAAAATAQNAKVQIGMATP
jgi:hypothetical protein